jgi:hypothetical protein
MRRLDTWRNSAVWLGSLTRARTSGATSQAPRDAATGTHFKKRLLSSCRARSRCASGNRRNAATCPLAGCSRRAGDAATDGEARQRDLLIYAYGTPRERFLSSPSFHVVDRQSVRPTFPERYGPFAAGRVRRRSVTSHSDCAVRRTACSAERRTQHVFGRLMKQAQRVEPVIHVEQSFAARGDREPEQ